MRRETARALTQIRDHYERSVISYTAPSATVPSSDPVVGDALSSVLKADRSIVGSLMPRPQPPSRPTPQTQALAYLLSGDAGARDGNNELAIEDYTKALAVRPDYREALIKRGAAYLAIRKFQEAVDDFSAAVRLAPEDPALRNRRANAFLTMGNLTKPRQTSALSFG